jgi:hypothetical protein
MKTIIIFLIIVLIFLSYMAITTDSRFKKTPVADAVTIVNPFKNNQTTSEYIIEIIEEEEGEE